jgi:hypothetical protein
VVWKKPIACNRASADFLMSSSLMPTIYERLVPDYDGYRHRLVWHDVRDARAAMSTPISAEQTDLLSHE